MEFTAKQIAEFLNGTVDGNENAAVHTFAKIEEGAPGALSFLSNVKYTQHIYTTKASVVLVNKDFKPEQPVSATLVRVDNAYEALAKLMSLYASMKPAKTGISSLASVSEKAKIGKNVYIAPFSVIEDGATVGDNTQIYPLVTIGEGASVGSDCILYPHVTIYYGCKVPQIGIAELEDDVEIGANTCIDRSTMGRTLVHKGVKLDNFVQVAHNVEVGENTVISAQSGIAGSSKVGAWCMIGGQSGVSGHLTIGDRVNFGAKTGALSSFDSDQNIMGYPAIGYRNFMRSSILFRDLPEMDKKVRQLEKEIEELKAQLANK